MQQVNIILTPEAISLDSTSSTFSFFFCSFIVFGIYPDPIISNLKLRPRFYLKQKYFRYQSMRPQNLMLTGLR